VSARAQIDLDLRPATAADSGIVADLDTARTPYEPRDAAMMAFWWTVNMQGEVFTRQLAERNGTAIAYLYGAHARWSRESERFVSIRSVLHPDIANPALFKRLVERAESWARTEGGTTAVARIRDDFKDELRVLERMGYREVRREREWQLNLVAKRERLLDGAELNRRRMAEQGVRMLTLDQDGDPEKLNKLYEVSLAADQDIPTTVPNPVMSYEEWHHLWFANPGTHVDRFWLAREGDAIVGLSAIEYPPTRGYPWTSFTATSRTARGRGIARALKHETVAQAIALGVERIGTSNDGENAPILHINADMGYEPTLPVLELHRELGS
jgi:GNAT superfamily N-acetyltransferase